MSMSPDAQRVGGAWESRAADHLVAQGLRIVARGYRCRLGELDIVASDGHALIIVEVRARRSSRYGSAIDTVDATKQRRLLRAARHFLMCHPAWNARPIRFDVIAYDAIESAEPKMRWIENAFAAA